MQNRFALAVQRSLPNLVTGVMISPLLRCLNAQSLQLACTFDFSSLCLINNSGGYVDQNYDPQGHCVFPYQGNLCSQCAQGYAKAARNSFLLKFFEINANRIRDMCKLSDECALLPEVNRILYHADLHSLLQCQVYFEIFEFLI